MKITDVQVVPLYIPLKETPPISTSGKASNYHVLIKVLTDEGIVGYGEAYRMTPGALGTFIEEALKPHLIGKDPNRIEMLWDLMYGVTFLYGRKGFVLNAISGIEIALWDILGKFRNLPIYAMIGGLCQDQIKAYASLPRYKTPEDVATAARRCVEDGYTAVKLHQNDMESIKAARMAVGPNIDLMLDVNGAWKVYEAVKMAKVLEEYGYLWLEEPVLPMDDYDGLAEVRESADLMIAAGENEYTLSGFKELIAKRAVDIVQPDVTKAGGILACRKIFALVEAWNLRLAMHSYCFGPGIAATVHLSLSNLLSEYVEIHALPLEAYYMHPEMRPEKGYITAPVGPGLGIEIDEDVVRQYPYEGMDTSFTMPWKKT
jgi:L-alanine-DL-glutamate epimerase-like enolase superfamily enzyme